MDLYSLKAIKLRDEMYEARAEMHKGRLQMAHAENVLKDCGGLNPDGLYAQHKALEHYRVVSDRYDKVLKAWFRHVLDS